MIIYKITATKVLLMVVNAVCFYSSFHVSKTEVEGIMNTAYYSCTHAFLCTCFFNL